MNEVPRPPTPTSQPQVRTLVAMSEPLRQLSSQLERAANQPGAALIFGESGSGRTTVAQVLHQRGPRSSGPFVTLNLAQISPAHQRELLLGRAALADISGTICINEIEILSAEAQAELAQKMASLPARVVATSTRPLEQWAGAGAFSIQLLSAFAERLRVPPLRERREDLPELVRALVAEVCAATRRPLLIPSEGFIAALARYDWPGNVAQLRAVLERATQRVGLEDELGTSALSSISEFREPGAFSPTQSYRDTRTHFEAGFEKAYVAWLLDRHQDNISAAAREARMDRKHLYDLARKHGLRHPRGSED